MKNTIRVTSKEVADLLLYEACITKGNRVLEPSAGKGVLAKYIKQHAEKHNLDIILDCVELNKNRNDLLKEKGFNVVGRDIMHFNPDEKYDRIIACPTFLKGEDMKQIKKMYSLCKTNGGIVSLTSPSWLTSTSKKSKDFRFWIKDKNYWLKMLPDNSFREGGKTRSTMMLVLGGM